MNQLTNKEIAKRSKGKSTYKFTARPIDIGLDIGAPSDHNKDLANKKGTLGALKLLNIKLQSK